MLSPDLVQACHRKFRSSKDMQKSAEHDHFKRQSASSTHQIVGKYLKFLKNWSGNMVWAGRVDGQMDGHIKQQQ